MLCYLTIKRQSSVVVRIKCSGKNLHRTGAPPPILVTRLVPCGGLHYQLKEPPKTEKGAAMSAALIGSRPPRCEGKCALCGRCEAVQVPVAPQDKGAAGRSRLFRAFGDSVDESSTNYKPLNWKCKCADRRILNP